MQAFYPAEFDREVGCTEAEWLGWLPAAVGDGPMQLSAGEAAIRIDSGSLRLSWQTMPPRVIALVRMPRMAVQFRFKGLDDQRRYTFMRRFDLYMQRGGG